MKTIRLATLLGVIALVLAALLAAASSRAFEALLLVADIGMVSLPSMLDTGSTVSVTPLCIGRKERNFKADLYLPEDSPAAGVVLLHGAAQTGKDDPRLVDFARQLATRRFAVLVPELPGLKRLRVRADETQSVVDAFTFLSTAEGMGKQTGIAAFSVASGLAFNAALDPAIREKVSFVFTIGAYHDLPRTLNAIITDTSPSRDGDRPLPANKDVKWLFVLSNLDKLPLSSDRRRLKDIATRRTANPAAQIDDLVSGLSDEGRRLLDYVTTDNPQRIAARYNALPHEVRQAIAALDLRNKSLSRLRATTLLVHGYEDSIIPYSESVSLAAALPDSELHLVHGLYHVDSSLRQLQTAREYWKVAYSLLSLRDRHR